MGNMGNDIKKEVELNSLICKLREENKKLKAENEKLKTIVDAVPCIVHDINNFLTPIEGSVEILKEEINDKSRLLNSIEVIEKCANDGINVSARLIGYLKGTAVKEETVFSVDEVITDIIEMMYKKYPFNKYRINFDLKADSNALIRGNITEVREIFLNILNNSVDAIKTDGSIRICTKKEGNFAKIEIKDNGTGMDEETKLKIFTPFFTTKGKGGLGVGLNICKKIIEKHGGNISCESILKKGTIFTIMFPCHDKENNIKAADRKYDFNGKVLIVDDQKQLRDIVSDMIKTVINCDVKAVSISELLENINVNEFNVIISDYLMPQINGIELAKLVKAKNPDVYFCLMTGWIGEFDEKNCNSIDEILYKPISLKQIRNLFSSLQNKKS